MEKMRKGFLIAIEGIDGSGKSLLSHNLYYRLKDLHQKVVLTKEPGGTPFGEKVYSQLINNQDLCLSPKTEFLLFAASRAEHFTKIVIPNLEQDSIVISDRMADSSLVYQGYAKHLEIAELRLINSWAMDTISPDLTIYLNINIDTALERIKSRNLPTHTFEKERSFLQKTIDGFNILYKDAPNTLILDGSLDPQTIVLEALDAIKKHSLFNAFINHD